MAQVCQDNYFKSKTVRKGCKQCTTLEPKFYIGMALILFFGAPATLLGFLHFCWRSEAQKERQNLKHGMSAKVSRSTHNILEAAEEELEVLKEELEALEVVIGVKVKILIHNFQVPPAHQCEPKDTLSQPHAM